MVNKCTDKKVTLEFADINGGAVSLMWAFRQQAKKEGWSKEEINCVLRECRSSNYRHLLQTLREYSKPPKDEF